MVVEGDRRLRGDQLTEAHPGAWCRVTAPDDNAAPLTWALWWAEQGVPVFPVKITHDHGDKTDKKPLTAHGHLDASTDPAQVEAWWRQHPGAAIGGDLSRNGWFAVDLDVTGGATGPETLADLERANGELPESVRVLTASGGAHVLMAGKVGSKNGWADGIDVKGGGGWVVLAGSRSPLGQYVFEVDYALGEVAVADCPAAWMELMPRPNGRSTGSASADVSGLGDLDRQAVEALVALGGHGATTTRTGDTVTAGLTRPGKRAGNAVSVGHLGPGVVNVFTPNWQVPADAGNAAAGKVLPEGVHDLDDLVAFIEHGTLDGDRPGTGTGTDAAPDPDQFIDKRDGLRAVTVAGAVRERVHLARMAVQGESDALDHLWHYRRGVFVPGGEKAATEVIVRLLGERHRHSHIGNVLDVLRADQSVQTIIPDAPHPEFVNFTNGMLELGTGRLVDHDPAFGSTVQVPHQWTPEARCPTVEHWLADVLPDPGMTEFMFSVLGYLLVNGNPWHRAFLLVGSGRNGKSTFLRLVEQMLGSGNVSSVPLDRLADGHRFASAEMFGRTANVCGDLAATHLRDTSTFKQLTGGDPVFAERKMRDPFTFTWWGVPIFSANAVPGADDTSHGFMSRWEIVRFPVDLTGRCDPGIESRLLAELSGVIVRAVEALNATIAAGDFQRPDAVIEAKAEFGRALDQVRGYVADWTTPGGWTKRDVIYADYLNWARQHGHGELGARKFYDRLRSAGIAEKKRNGDRGFELTLGAPVDPPGQLGAGRAGSPSPAARTGEKEEHLPYLPQPAPAHLTEADLDPFY